MVKALVIGMGISGKAAAQLLIQKGFEIYVFDDKPQSYEALLSNPSVSSVTLETFPKDCELAIVAPGIAPSHPMLKKCQDLNLPIDGEVNFALKGLSQPCIAITGTNGKTTVTVLIEHVLKHAGLKAKAIGNVGEAVSTYALNPKEGEILVIELSSFQIETLSEKKFDASILLNITPDHLDRYSSMIEYAKVKCDLQNFTKESAPFYVHDSVVAEYKSFQNRPWISYGEKGEYSCDKTAFYHRGKKILELPESFQDKGVHDLENALAAYLIAAHFGAGEKQFEEALNTFQKPKHRIEYVTTLEGIHFYDDSKGTNIDAVIRAVAAMPSDVILIAGGVDKGFPYHDWIKGFDGKVKKIIAIGQASEKIEKDLQQAFVIEKAATMKEAVEKARKSAKTGDSVLLSPGCSSFDMFKDYADRGNVFQQSVKNLAKIGEL